jgi:hypothetical protein
MIQPNKITIVSLVLSIETEECDGKENSIGSEALDLNQTLFVTLNV